MATTVPPHVVIGQLNLKLDKFDDTPQLIKNGGYKKINAIRVFYTDKYVRGFEIFYKLNDGDLMKAGHNVPKRRKELKNTVFEIGPDDYLSEIQGAYEEGKKNKIINITFLTYRGKAATFGGQGPKAFSFAFPGHTFGSFTGGYKKQIEWLQVVVLPLPEEFKRELSKINVNVFVQPSANNGSFQPMEKNHIQGFAKVAMPMIAQPQIATFAKAQSYDGSVSGSSAYSQPISAPDLMSSKYPTFNAPPQQTNNQQFQYQQPVNKPNPFTAQAQYPGQVQQAQYPAPQQGYPAPQGYPAHQQGYPTYQYPGQVNGGNNTYNK